MRTSHDAAESGMLGRLLDVLPAIVDRHAPRTPLYDLLKGVARLHVERLLGDGHEGPMEFGPFGALDFPYYRMGVLDSRNLFDLDELILFSFYWANRGRYRRVADIGANIGLHAVLLARCGFEVRAFEPDPDSYRQAVANLSRNRAARAEAFNCAVSDVDGRREFVRLLDNRLGSHLAGAKPDPYGPLERFEVEVRSIRSLIGWADLLKIDAEGEERRILLATRAEDWSAMDAVVEVGNEASAGAIYNHAAEHRLRLFAQRLNWHAVEKPVDMPTSYRDGSLFITANDRMPW